MSSAFTLFNLVLGFSAALAYKIPSVKLEILPQGFRVSIPDEAGVSKVFYGIEINNMCPAHLDYITESRNGFWSTEQNVKLTSDMKVTIFLMVQHNDDVFKATEYIKIDNDGKLVVVSANNTKIYEDCEETGAIGLEQKESLRNKTCAFSLTVTRNVFSPCKGDLIFEETFDESTELRLNRWSYDIRLRLDASVAEFVVLENNERNQFIKSGIFHIHPTIVDENIRARNASLDLGSRCTAVINPKRDCSVLTDGHFIVLPPVHSSQVHTRNSFSFMYGRIEVRAKLPKGDWILPYIILQPLSTLVDSEQAPHIRVAFARGNTDLVDNVENSDIGGNRLYGGVYYWHGLNRQSVTRNVTQDQHFGDDFHIYSLMWEKNRISVAVDGASYGEITEGLDSFQEECFLILGVSAGGHLEFTDNVSTRSGNSIKSWLNTSPKATLDFWRNRETWRRSWNGDEALQVDYVKVYAV